MLLYSTTPLFLVKEVPDRGSYVWDPCAEGRQYLPDLKQSTAIRYKEKRLLSSSIKIFERSCTTKPLADTVQ
jgi:hypothetical protein